MTDDEVRELRQKQARAAYILGQSEELAMRVETIHEASPNNLMIRLLLFLARRCVRSATDREIKARTAAMRTWGL